jgi:nitroimidazol reductase NimA-like FMN-containing flavoprotein (pyridoxamine 5'-phosphate oxidase superfamily)
LGDPRVRDFLAHGTRTGKLAFLAADGRPLVAPVWFIVEDDSLVFNTNSQTAKGRALARDGVPGELVVRLRPLKVVANFDITG